MKREIQSKAPTYEMHPDNGCELYPTCQGDGEYPQCPFSMCFEDLGSPDSEHYDRKKLVALRKWFLGKRRVK